jgi:hypothetical protein
MHCQQERLVVPVRYMHLHILDYAIEAPRHILFDRFSMHEREGVYDAR